MHTSDKTLQMNTGIDIRKTLTDVIQKHPRQSKYSKDNTDKNPYPWLDKKKTLGDT